MSDSRLRNYWRLNMLSTGSALLIALLLLLGYHGYREHEDLRKNLTMQANFLGANLTAAIVFEDARAATEIIGTANASPIILEAAVYRVDGSLMARFQRLDATPRLTDQAPAYDHVFSATELQLVMPVQLAEQTVGSIALRASLDDMYANLGRIFVSMFLIVAVSAALGTYISRTMRLRMAATESAIERMALYDHVTGLANRHAFELALSQTLQRHARDSGGLCPADRNRARGTHVSRARSRRSFPRLLRPWADVHRPPRHRPRVGTAPGPAALSHAALRALFDRVARSASLGDDS